MGYDSFWTTEHHFQHEGYEVIPNGLQLSTWIAAHTERLRLGTMFNVVPQWNPMRLAEDFATMHNLSGGRGILGVGRGTVPREVLHLNDKGVSIGSHDNPDQAADDERNRKVFEESMEIVRRALSQERFSFEGEFFQIPVPGIPDRGSTVQALTLVPKPLYPYEIWQAVTSPPTLETVPVARPRRRVLEPALPVHRAFLEHLRRALRGGPRRRAGAGRAADAGHLGARRGHLREGGGDGDTGPRRVLEVPRPLRLEPRLHGRGRQAGQARPDPDVAGVDRQQDHPPRHAAGRRRGRALLPGPARPAST